MDRNISVLRKIIVPANFRNRLYFSFGSILLIILIAVATAVNFADKILELGELRDATVSTQIQVYEMFERDQRFIQNNTINLYYYRTGQSQFLDKRDQDKRKLDASFSSVQTAASSVQIPVLKLSMISEELNDYHRVFAELSRKQLARGFKDFGKEGQMRHYVHLLMENSKLLSQSDLLMLRRHEKDFFLRFDMSYVIAHNELSATMLAQLDKSTASLARNDSKLLHAYIEMFNEIVELDVAMGRDFSSGLSQSMYAKQSSVKQDLFISSNRIFKAIQAQQEDSLQNIFNVLMAALGITIILIYFMVRSISRPIEEIAQQVRNKRKLAQPQISSKKFSSELRAVARKLNRDQLKSEVTR